MPETGAGADLVPEPDLDCDLPLSLLSQHQDPVHRGVNGMHVCVWSSWMIGPCRVLKQVVYSVRREAERLQLLALTPLFSFRTTETLTESG